MTMWIRYVDSNVGNMKFIIMNTSLNVAYTCEHCQVSRSSLCYGRVK